MQEERPRAVAWMDRAERRRRLDAFRPREEFRKELSLWGRTELLGRPRRHRAVITNSRRTVSSDFNRWRCWRSLRSDHPCPPRADQRHVAPDMCAHGYNRCEDSRERLVTAPWSEQAFPGQNSAGGAMLR